LTNMTKDAKLKSKIGRKFKSNQKYRTVMIVMGLFVAALLVAAPASTQVSKNSGNGKSEVFQGRPAVANEVLVKFREATSPVSIAQAEQDGDVDSDEEVGGTGVRLFHSRSKDVTTLVSELSTRSDVEYAEPNYIVYTTAVPNDPQFSALWGLQNTGQNIGCGVGCFGNPVGTAGADIKATLAWDVSTGSRANVVAVVDTGIDYNHPDLAANVWSAPTAFTVNIGGTVINCAAGSHGFNAINNTCNPLDDNDHGSHTSGTIGASGNNGVGVVGVNWTASIMGAKFLDASGSGTTAGAINAIEFTIQAKAFFGANANVRVLSNSWGGGGFSQALLDEINKANTNNMLFVAAAGNNATNNDTTAFYPANYNAPNVVAVAATDNRDQLASFSNFGRNTVHLGGPGVDVLSTTRNNTYSYFSGTSMATPHVSGAAALVLSGCPSLDTAALKSNLLSNVDPIASLSGNTITGGRLNVNKAIRACSAPPTPDFSLSATPASQTVTQGASTTYTVTVTPSGGFTGTVSFSASGLPAGAGASFNPASVTTSGSSTMTVTTSATTPTGTFPLTITGASGALSHTASVSLVVQPAATPDFSLSTTPSSVTVTAGSNAIYTENITRTGGFTGSVTLSISGLPAGAAGSFNPNPASGASSALTVTTSSTTPAGSFVFTVTGISGALTRTSTATLVVQAPGAGNFTLSITPTSRSVNPGQGTTYTVNITRTGGFAGSVTLSVSGLGTGASGTFSPNPTTGNSSTLTVTTTTSATPGSRVFTVTGISGSLTRTATATLVVTNCVNGNGECQ
jgi:subtilisin family serine protease